MQGRIQDFGLGGALAVGLGDESPPAGSRGRAPVGVWGEAPEARRMLYVVRLKTTYREKKQVNTD